MQVEAVADAMDALSRIRRGDPFDAAVLDQEMPGMDGIRLAREIRRHRDELALPLVLLTSIGQLADARGAPEFSARLTKPVKASQLYDALVRILAPELRTDAASGVRGDGPIRAAPSLRVLVAEDNAVNQRLALALLGKLGYRADVVETGRAALDALERDAYDIVLMDVQMPELDGLEATREIRSRFGTGNQPAIIAMTANAMEGDRDECLAAGMDDYLAKPIHLDALAQALARCDRTAVDAAALARLSSSLGGGDEGREAMGELVDVFLEDATKQMALLRDAVERRDAQEVWRVAHSLKSTSATFGARALSQLCAELEAMGRRDELEAAQELVERADHEWKRVRAALAPARRSAAAR
jgi:CheY-like chemotaxis protein